MTKRHVDYVKDYSANLTPVIPHDAKMSPRSSISLDNRGKVPGRRGVDGWYGGWKDMGDADILSAKLWDGMGAGIGFRTGRTVDDVHAIDPDLTNRQDAERVLAIARTTFGDKLAVRRVDHPEHTKLLVCFRIAGKPMRHRDVIIKQSDGTKGVVQAIGPGRYFNVHGIHPQRLRPYVWEYDPADTPLITVDPATFLLFWTRLGEAFETVIKASSYSSREVAGDPEQCSPEELEALIKMIPNDHRFALYQDFIEFGAAVFGASGGSLHGRGLWLDWCGQVEQGDEDKPERFWDTMLKAQLGAGRLRRWANERDPQAMARRAFVDPPPDPEAVKAADEDADFAKRWLDSYCLVGGAEFFSVPPFQPYSSAAFNLMHAKDEKRLRRHFGDKRNPLSYVFARQSPNIAEAVVHEPGKSRFIDRQGRKLLNLWTAPPRPHYDKPIDPEIVDFYEELVAFVLGDPNEARLWLLWHAYLLQHPDWAPGWHWLIQTDTRLGKDLIASPITLAHGDDYESVNPKVLAGDFNAYAQKHLIVVSEMRERGRDDVYTMLKTITSGNPVVQIHRKHRDPYLAPNVAGFIIYSNDPHPLKLAHDDQRFRVVANFGVKRRSPAYYAQAVELFKTHWAMISEWLIRMKISDDDLNLLKSVAPESEAKTQMALKAWERLFLDIVGEIESDSPPPGYLPIATTGDLIKMFKAQELPVSEMPNRLNFPADLYRLDARPLMPTPNDEKRANPIMGSRLWRIARFWTDSKGVRWNIESAAPARLAQLYSDRVMPPPDLKAVDDEEDQV
jgi:hypothetical protein